jgi:hypothetical protein
MDSINFFTGGMIFLGQEKLVGTLCRRWNFSCVIMCEVTSFRSKFFISLEVNENCEKSSITSLWNNWPCWGTPKLVELIVDLEFVEILQLEM